MPSQRRRPVRATATLFSVVFLQVGCRGWVEKPVVPDTGVGMAHPGVVRVTTSDSSIVTLKDFIVRHDSIVGFSSDGLRSRIGVARTDVTKIEMRGDITPRPIRVVGNAYVWVLRIASVAGALAGLLLIAQ
jgi:hypothetical protein